MKTQGRKLARALAGTALFACVLIGSGAHALELGQAVMRSTLGERLLVDIPIRDAAMAAPNCFSARLAGVRQALGMRKTGDRLTLSTPRLISEPLLELTVTVSCPNIARLQRSYTLFVDPAPMSRATQTYLQPTPDNVGRTLAADQQRPQRAVAAAPPVQVGRPYLVQIGDTVSEIAQNLTPAGESIWPTVDRIVADNPQAFVDGDADRLIAGATLALTSTGAIIRNPRTRPPTPPSPPSSTPPAGAPTQAPALNIVNDARLASEPAAAPARTQADQLLRVLQGERQVATGSEAPVPASPFKAQTQTPVAAETLPASEPESDSEATLGWLDRVIALAAGMVLTALAWVGWQIVTGVAARRRRERAFQAPLASAVNDDLIRNGATVRTPPALAESTDVIPVARQDVEDGYEVAFADDDDDETFSFYNAGTTPANDESPTAEMKTRSARAEDNFEVTALESIGMTTIMRGLDAETQKLLEQDYESELTHTQQLRKDITERALARGAGASGYDDTEEMPLIGDTALMTAADEIEDDTHFMDGATEASFVDTAVNPDETAPTSLDLDIDDPSVSVVLRESADLLAEALNEFDEDDDDDASLVERQA